MLPLSTLTQPLRRRCKDKPREGVKDCVARSGTEAGHRTARREKVTPIANEVTAGPVRRRTDRFVNERSDGRYRY
jgi:hypothetical protein